jgi:ribosome maturation factor RimP
VSGRLEIERKLREIASRVTEPLGLEVVELALRGAGSRQILRLDVDRPGPTGVTLADCKRVSEALGAALDEEDPIAESYVLEVSSPGIDRPIRSADDIRRNTGRKVVVTSRDPERGERSVRGLLLGAEGPCLVVETESGRGPGERVRIPLDRVVRARQEVELQDRSESS